MGVDLLFDEDKAFVIYLLKIPNLPLAVPAFLDALWSYDESTKHDVAERRQAIFDLIKPISLAIDGKLPQTSAARSIEKGVSLCDSCDCTSLKAFFPHRGSFCRSCYLKKTLNEEVHRLRRHKLQILGSLFPHWVGGEHDENWDGPSPRDATSLIRRGRKAKELLTRICLDSSQKLPTLKHLACEESAGD